MNRVRQVARVALLLGCAGWSCARTEPLTPDSPLGIVTVDSTTRFQTMSGWEAVAQIGAGESGYSAAQAPQLFDDAVNNLGLNRIRLEVRAGAENRIDYYQQMRAGQQVDWRAVRYATVNDNADPLVIDPAGFHFTDLDENVERIVLPMRQRLEARGEKLIVNLCYVGFVTSSNGYVHEDPAEYAELVLATFQHLRDRYGLTPDAVEMILEPDNTPMWRGTLIGRAMVATAARLRAAGFTPMFVAPSNTSMSAAIDYFDEMINVPGVQGVVTELAYHRYRGVSDANLSAIGERTKRYGIRSAMLEHIGSGVDDLYADLTLGNASGWEQFALAFPTDDNGAQYYVWKNGQPQLSARAALLRQYFHYVRLGAVRVAATATTNDVKPVAFRNTSGGFAVVVHVEHGGELEVRGLPAGNYGVSITTAAQSGQELGVFVASAAGAVRFSAPASGVLTVYRK